MIMKRELYLQRIRPYYDNNLIKVILGPRRSGKSEILKMIRNELYLSGVEENRVIYLNFEDIELTPFLDAVDLNKRLKEMMGGKGKCYLMFDEIQHVDGYERLLASLKANTDASIFVTGSSTLLRGTLATLLTGRYLDFTVRPFTYAESIAYLEAIGRKIEPDFLERDYLKWGGFPQRFDFLDDETRRGYLMSLYNDTIEKDIIAISRKDGKRSNVSKGKFARISSYLLANAGQEWSPSSLERFLSKSEDAGSISENTIRNYAAMMEKAFLIERVDRYSVKGKRALVAKPKFYAFDNGMRFIQRNADAALTTFFLENLVYNELKTRGYEVNIGKKYQGEIDFVVSKGSKRCYIQVAYFLTESSSSLDVKSAYEREYGAFKHINDGCPRYVMSLDKADTSHDGIEHIFIEDFLLGKSNIRLS